MKNFLSIYTFIRKAVPKAVVMGALGAIMMTSPALASQQAKWVGDLPIMPSLSIETGLGFAFDSPEGRIVIVYLSGGATPTEVRGYYAAALKPLGWRHDGDMRWTRGHEYLTITRTTAGTAELWKLTISPF